MARLMILAPATIAAIAVSRGDGGENLLTPDPKEVWADSAAGTAATLDIDLGAAQPVDSIFLGYIHNAVAGANWTITGGVAGYTDQVIKAAGALRVTDAAGRTAATSHGLWHDAPVNVRYLRLAVTQPAGQAPLMAGILMLGSAFVPSYDKEWGAGRQPIDMGTATALPSGGFSIVEGARKASYSWTLGDLSIDETERLYDLVVDRGVTRPVLVVEDPSSTAGLVNRIHYGLFQNFRAYERQNLKQTKWELGIEQWV